MATKVFVNSPLSSLSDRMLNDELERVLTNLGFQVYMPQRILPPDGKADNRKVFERNRKAVEEADVILTVLDKPGLGSIFELGYATAKKKRIVLFRTDKQDYLGKVVEGMWEAWDNSLKARSFRELNKVLASLRGGSRRRTRTRQAS